MKYLISALLASLTIALFTAACVAGETKAAPLMVSVQATPQPHDPPAEPTPIVKTGPNLTTKIDAKVPDLVRWRWGRLAERFPDTANRIKRIEVRRVNARWSVSYEAQVVYINLHFGEYVIADKLTDEFAKRAYADLRKYQPTAAKAFRTWKAFAAALAAGVR